MPSSIAVRIFRCEAPSMRADPCVAQSCEETLPQKPATMYSL